MKNEWLSGSYSLPVELQGVVERNGIAVETLRIGNNFTLTAAPVEHEDGFECHRELVTELVYDSDLVIPEYFAPEIRQMLERPATRALLERLPVQISTNFTDFIPFFDEVASVAAESNKPVKVLDPAYNEKFLAVRFAPLAIAGAGLGLRYVSTKLHEGLVKNGSHHLGGAMALGGFASFGTRLYENRISKKPFPHVPSEAYMRRYTVAQGIMQLVQNAEEQKTPCHAFLLYPPSHWQVIKDLLQRDVKRNIGFKAYSLPLQRLGISGLTTVRSYKWNNEEWVKVEEEAIK